MLGFLHHLTAENDWPDDDQPRQGTPEALIILLPLLIILSTLLFLLLFLISMILLRRRRSILLRDFDGPIDLSREESIESSGQLESIEANWIQNTPDEEVREYNRAKDWQNQYPPNSLPTDITLSQFLSIQEKGVSAWSFEPDYEILNALIVHSRTEITFLPDPPFASTSVQSNLPLPKLNEVYYWEVKLFDLPETTSVSIGLTTKPYPNFRLPGLNRFSVAYHTNGDKSHNYPFNATSFGAPLKEGDVIGVGYRPRHGTVFFTRNGRKTEDAFTGLSRWNLFPTVGADGPGSVHVNFGQAGFVFIEANVKKWGLAPMVGTLAPPPAYGSERGSILLAAGGNTPPDRTRIEEANRHPRRAHRIRTRPSHELNATPTRPSPLGRNGSAPSSGLAATPEGVENEPLIERYVSPTDQTAPLRNPPILPESPSPPESEASFTPRREHPPLTPDSPTASDQLNPPTPHQTDIRLQAWPSRSSSQESRNSIVDELHVTTPGGTVRQPPDYSPLDPYRYSEGVQLDLPAEIIQAAVEGAFSASANRQR